MKNHTLRLLAVILTLSLLAACGGKKDPHPTNSMTYRTLGSTGLQVSEISIGCNAFTDIDSTQSRHFLDIAIDSGINYIDIYDPNPIVRANIGFALRGRRDKMIIQGHIGNYWNDDNKYERTRDVEKCRQGFDQLLQLLETDHIEVGMIHIVDNLKEWDEIIGSPYLDYVQQLKKEGKIKHIGVSSHNAEAALAAAKSGLVEVIMFSLNPAYDRLSSNYSIWDSNSFQHTTSDIDPVRQELYQYCADHNIAITVMKVFGSGSGRLLDESQSPIKVKLTPVQCISYALSTPAVATAVCGVDNIDELLIDIAYEHSTPEERDFQTPISRIKGHDTRSGDCTYCNHCSPCPVGINIGKVNELLDRANKEGSVSKALAAEYKALDHHASECTACGGCERRCPFEVPVREKMKQATKTFGY